MTTTRDTDRIIGAWLDLMPDEAPDRAVDAIIDAVEITSQVPRPRFGGPPRPARVASMAAAAFVVAVAGVALFRWLPESAIAPPTLPVPTPTQPSVLESQTVSPSSPAQQLAPGDRWILYVSPPPEPGLFLVRPDGSDAHRIAADVPGVISDPTWSPDGNQVAFVATGPSGVPVIWGAAADGTAARVVTGGGGSCPDGVAGPGWSPDGSRISLICHSGSGSSIRVLDLGSGSTAELTAVTAPEWCVSPPRWSPDGRTIAFGILVTDPSSGDVLGGSLLALVPSAGGDVVRITTADALATYPDWAPGGDRLTFTYLYPDSAIARDPAGVGTIRSDGTRLERLTATDGRLGIGEARWSPEADELFAVGVAHGNPKRLVRLDATTGEVTAIGIEGEQPQPRPGP